MRSWFSLMRTSALVAVLFVCVWRAQPAVGETIGFDDFNTGGSTAFAAADRYISQGIVFSRTIPVEDVQTVEPAFYPTFLAQGGTPLNAMALTPTSPVGFLSVNASFVVPGTSIPSSTTDTVTVRVFDTEVGTTLGTLEAFNSSGVLIATDTVTTPSSQAGTLEVAVPDIASVQFSSDSDGALFDNLSFDFGPGGNDVPGPGGTVVPEPGSIFLLLAPLLGFLYLRTKRAWGGAKASGWGLERGKVTRRAPRARERFLGRTRPGHGRFGFSVEA